MGLDARFAAAARHNLQLFCRMCASGTCEAARMCAGLKNVRTRLPSASLMRPNECMRSSVSSYRICFSRWAGNGPVHADSLRQAANIVIPL